MPDEHLNIEQRAQQEEHRSRSLASVQFVVEDFAANSESAVVEALSRRVSAAMMQEDWTPAQEYLSTKLPGLKLRERFRLLPYWSVCRLVLDEYESGFVPKRMLPLSHYKADDPAYLAELDTVAAWLDADASSRPEIGRYAVLEERELRALLNQPYLLLPSELRPAAYDRGWLGGRAWQIKESWSEQWLKKLAQEQKLAHFYCWLKARCAENPRYKPQ